MKKILIPIVILAFILVGCSLPEWQDIQRDAGVYTGAGPNATLPVIVGTGAEQIVERVASPLTILFYIVGGIGTCVLGWFNRKYIKGAYDAVKTKLAGQ